MFLKTRHNPYKGFRISCLEVFCEKDVLKSFSKFTGKQLLLWPVGPVACFNKAAG